MGEDEATRAVDVPGPFERAFNGIVVRDGRYHWSARAQFARVAIAGFILDGLGRYVLLRDAWRGEPEWMGIPGLSVPIAGGAAMVGLMISTMIVLTTRRERLRFNAAPPPVPGAIEGSGGHADVPVN
ncbi:MAG TPA: hypothetical protein VHG08_00585 [Longimicrobium sp.]|nr:hypothetical protein [Longimicrobium sp.]